MAPFLELTTETEPLRFSKPTTDTETRSSMSNSPWRQLFAGRGALAPLLLLILLSALALSAPWLLTDAPDRPIWEEALRAPGVGHWLGTDAIGRDMLARVLAGTGISLAVGLGAGVLALLLGTLIGAVAGYLGGWVDEVLMRVNDLLLSLPLLLIAILLMSVTEPSLWLLMAVIGGFGSLDAARMLRLEARRLRHADFLLAVRLQGAGNAQLIRRHLLPNLAPVALTALGLVVPQAILVESFLAFLGLSPTERIGSLGTLLAEGVQDLQWAPWTLLGPAVALALVLLAFGLLGDALRARLRALTSAAL